MTFFGISPIPMMITYSKDARQLKLGQRMSLMVGGAGGVAALILLSTGPIAMIIGVKTVLLISAFGYLLSSLIGIVIMTRK